MGNQLEAIEVELQRQQIPFFGEFVDMRAANLVLDAGKIIPDFQQDMDSGIALTKDPPSREYQLLQAMERVAQMIESPSSQYDLWKHERASADHLRSTGIQPYMLPDLTGKITQGISKKDGWQPEVVLQALGMLLQYRLSKPRRQLHLKSIETDSNQRFTTMLATHLTLLTILHKEKIY